MTGTIHVLLIEDSAKDAALIVRELRRSGIDVVAERVDNSEALEHALKTSRWDIILADHEMPSFDSFRALEIVRARDPEASYVIVSGAIGDDLAVEAMRAGAQDYVLKDRLGRLGPVVKRELVEAELRRERVRAIEALRESEARKAAILEAALDAVITMDHRGDVVDLNTAAERMFGYPQQDVVGREMAELIIPPPLRDAHRQGLSRYMATGEGPVLGKRFEFPAMRRDGSEFPADIAITRIVRAGPAMFTGFIRDIADRKRLEARQRLLAEAGVKLVGTLDCTAMLQSIAVLVVGYVADWCGIDLLGAQGEGGLNRVAAAHGRTELPPSFEPASSVAQQVIHDRRAALRGSYMVAPLVARGKPLGVMTLVLAPGERTYSADDLDLVEDLSARCAMAVENAMLFDQVRDSVRGRDEFIAIAAHELRTPLTPLQVQAEALAADELTPGHLRIPILQILRASERLAALVERLLDFSRLTVGESQLDLEEHDLVALAAEVVGELARELDRTGSTIVWDTPLVPLVGRWDRHRVKLALRNFLTNAIKFAPGTPVEVSVRAVGSHARLAVKDQGPGLAPEDQAKVFDRYRRPAPISNYGGFGLGLWIVRCVAEQHGGRVEVTSELGEGAEFALVLPRDPHHETYGPA